MNSDAEAVKADAERGRADAVEEWTAEGCSGGRRWAEREEVQILANGEARELRMTAEPKEVDKVQVPEEEGSVDMSREQQTGRGCKG